MHDYFAYSQSVRRELEGRADLTAIAKRRLEIDIGRDKEPEIIGSGDSNIVYRIGRLDSGLWVALRARLFPHEMAQDLVQDRYEFFCQRAEAYHNQGRRPPSFCVGVVGRHESEIGILLEDFTEGGKRMLICDPCSVEGHLDGNDGECIEVDLDNLYGLPIPAPKYFAPGNRINF